MTLGQILIFHSAKFEATENDLPASVPFRVQGFPTIKLKRAGSREFIDYEGDRSFESLEAFLQEHAKNSLEFAEVPAEKAEESPTDTNEAAQTPISVVFAQETEVAHEEL